MLESNQNKKHKKMKIKKYIALFLLLMLSLLPGLSLAFQAQSSERLNIDSPITGDAYLSGEVVRINNNINGDLLLAAAEASINSNIQQDATIAAGNIRITGKIGDDLRVAAGNVFIENDVQGDLIVAGGQVTIGQGATIFGDVAILSGAAQILGKVNGNIWGTVGEIEINNVVKGNIEVTVDQLFLGSQGKINGNLHYSSSKPAKNLNESQIDGKTTYESTLLDYDKKELAHQITKFIGYIAFLKFLSLLFIGLIALWLLRRYLINSTYKAYEKTLASLGYGLVIIIMTPIIAVLLMFTGIGLMLSILLWTIWVMIIIFGGILSSLLIGLKIFRYDEKESLWKLYLAFGIGALIFILIGFIPYIGMLAQFIIASISIGGAAQYEIELVQFLRKKKLL